MTVDLCEETSELPRPAVSEIPDPETTLLPPNGNE